jgi:hypothetical protein
LEVDAKIAKDRRIELDFCRMMRSSDGASPSPKSDDPRACIIRLQVHENHDRIGIGSLKAALFCLLFSETKKNSYDNLYNSSREISGLSAIIPKLTTLLRSLNESRSHITTGFEK